MAKFLNKVAELPTLPEDSQFICVGVKNLLFCGRFTNEPLSNAYHSHSRENSNLIFCWSGFEKILLEKFFYKMHIAFALVPDES